MVENEERRMILHTLISECMRFDERLQFYHMEILVGARKMIDGITQKGTHQCKFRDSPTATERTVIMELRILASD